MEEKKSNLLMENRKKLTLTGVIEVINYNERQINLSTILGKILIKGDGLKLTKLDVQGGDIIIVGRIDSYVYQGVQAKQDNESIIAKLFK